MNLGGCRISKDKYLAASPMKGYKVYFIFCYPCGRYRRLCGGADRSNRAGTVTGGKFWTDL